jgi:DNA polymerase
MEGRRRVLGPANGPLQAPVMFVAEAPGRFGAERTGVPLSGDQAGRAFEHLLACAGWTRQEVFVTNAVLCNPLDQQGRNRCPSARELDNCRRHLRAQIELVAPRLLVALGATALHTLDRIEPHGLRLSRDVGRAVPWHGRYLVALYHPGPRALVHRHLAQQEADFRALRRLVVLRGPGG